MIQLINIEIGYNKTLLSASFNLVQGKLYALIGRNGSGKTTFLRSLSGNTRLLHGNIRIGDSDIHQLSHLEKALKIAFVETRISEISFMSGYEFVALGRTPYTNAFGRLKKSDKEIIDTTFNFLDINHLKDKFTSQMSDGEKQLIHVAKALVQDTQIILMDEPLAFLDYSNKRILIEKIKKTCIEFNKCIIVSSHEIELCLEFETEFLIVSEKEKTIIHKQMSDKKTILNEAFSIIN